MQRSCSVRFAICAWVMLGSLCVVATHAKVDGRREDALSMKHFAADSAQTATIQNATLNESITIETTNPVKKQYGGKRSQMAELVDDIAASPLGGTYPQLQLGSLVKRDTGAANSDSDLEEYICRESFYTCEEDEADMKYLGLNRSCWCDALCAIYGDCCQGAPLGIFVWLTTPNDVTKQANVDVIRAKMPFLSTYSSCRAVLGESFIYFPYYMIDRCPEDGTNHVYRELCESPSDDWLLNVPVSHRSYGVLFPNIYCALCHGLKREDVVFWGIELGCLADDDSPSYYDDGSGDLDSMEDKLDKVANMECYKLYKEPEDVVKPRECQDVIGTCNASMNTDQSLCHNAPNAYVYHGRVGYRNVHCARCNGIDNDQLKCRRPPYGSMVSVGREILDMISIRVLLTVDNRMGQSLQSCQKDEIYDFYQKKCRALVCPERFSLSLETFECQPSQMESYRSVRYDSPCVYVAMGGEEAQLLENDTVYINSSGKVLEGSDYYLRNATVYVCSSEVSSGYGKKYDLPAAIESWLSLLGQIISIIALIILIAIYLSFAELRTLPGKCLLGLAFCLMFAQFFFVLGIFKSVRDVYVVCKILGILTHFCFLGSFAWMSIMSFDVWYAFYSQFGVTDKSEQSAKFRWYCLIAFLVPLLIILISIILNEVGSSLPRPAYGESLCWINDTRPLLYLFVIPLGICVVVNTGLFIASAYLIYKASTANASLLRKPKSGAKRKRLVLYAKLSTVMGLTWLFGFLAASAGTTALWILFVIFNTLQGLFICIAFLCNRKVARLFRHRANRFSDRSSSSGRQSTRKTLLSSRV